MSLIRIRKGKITKRIPTEQWESMLKNNATYGWEISTELPSEIAEVEEKIISEIAVTQTDEPQESKQGEITNLLNAGVRVIRDELPNLNTEELKALLDAENKSEEPRKSLIDLLQKQIKKTS